MGSKLSFDTAHGYSFFVAALRAASCNQRNYAEITTALCSLLESMVCSETSFVLAGTVWVCVLRQSVVCREYGMFVESESLRVDSTVCCFKKSLNHLNSITPTVLFLLTL